MENEFFLSLRGEVPALEKDAEGKLRGGFTSIDASSSNLFSSNATCISDTACSDNNHCSGNSSCFHNTNCYSDNGCSTNNNPLCTQSTKKKTVVPMSGGSLMI